MINYIYSKDFRCKITRSDGVAINLNLSEKTIKRKGIEDEIKFINDSMFTSDDLTLPTKLKMIIYGVKEVGHCKTCGKVTEFTKGGKFRDFCSRRCMYDSKEIAQKRKQTTLERYGDENYRNIEQIRQTTFKNFGYHCSFESPEVQEKTKKTLKRRLGVDHPSKSQKVLDKKDKNNLKKYGVPNVAQVKQFHDKMVETNLRFRGVPYTFMDQDVINKGKETSRDRYGFDNPMKSPTIKAKNRKTIEEKYGATSF